MLIDPAITAQLAALVGVEGHAKDTHCGFVAESGEVECPGCGRVLPETTGQHWEVTDGDPLGCGCDGCWSADGEHADPVHDDECLQCARDEIEDLRARLAAVLKVVGRWSEYWPRSESPALFTMLNEIRAAATGGDGE